MTSRSSSPEWFAVLGQQEAGMPKLTRIYTRTGDDGSTGLVGGRRVRKDASRIEAYGTVDELSSAIGVARAALAVLPGDAPERARGVAEELDRWLAWTQDALFNLGSDLATADAGLRSGIPAIRADDAAALERAIDEAQHELPALDAFILPGGSYPGAFLHLARTIALRAERVLVALAATENVDPLTMRYLNRLSDALFVWSRWINHALGQPESRWNPKTAPPA
jgi:cob(I)alamin adenosyltransferase